jgi:non-specific serine/threonine protein kinase
MALATLVSAVINAGREASRARARSSLGNDAFDRALAAGQAMTLEEAMCCSQALGQFTSRTANSRTAWRRPSGASPLTARESEVAALVARGLTNCQIADGLVVTEGTAASHVEHIRTKLGFHSRAQIAAWATENHLTASAGPR